MTQSGEDPHSMIGTRLGTYEITAKLGEGGMGEVYRAHDTQLDRDVAIKVLPAAFVEDHERLSRFEREAKLLAQLNHPNIAHIYGMEASGAAHALIMELVEGPTLADRLESGSLPLDESLSLARQIAEALEEAHKKGIIHRDLKPQNIKASTEGRVKVLDFGLAKAMEPASGASASDSASQLAHSPTLTLGATVQGMILGTAAYMAPEQAKGLAIDKRADIWAFGVVLYELLVGRSLFAGETVGDTLAAVIRAEIDLDRLSPETPTALRRLLRRCLERNPKNRLHDIADARLVIDDVLAGRSDEAESAAAGAVAPFPATVAWRGRIGWLAGGLALGVAAAIVLGLGVGARFGTAPAAAPTLTRIEPLASGQPYEPAISRDGNTLAFAATRNGENRVWLKDLASGSESALAREGSSWPSFSPDGTSLLFLVREGDSSDLYRISLATREERLVARDAGPAAWSPDGRSVAFVRGEFNNPVQKLMSVDVDGGAEQALFERRGSQRFFVGAPRWSPDGRRLAMAILGGQAGVGDRVGVFELATGELEELEPRLAGLDKYRLMGRDWITNDRLVLLIGDDPSWNPASRSGRIALFDLSTRRARDVLPIQPVGGQIAYAGSGAVIVGLATTEESLFEVRRTPAGWADPVQLTEGPYTDRQPVYSPDGRSIVFASNRSGNNDLWRLERDSGELRRLTDHEATDWDPAFSKDGTRILFSSNRSGRFEIWIAEADGSAPRQVTDVENAQNPTWTTDGDWIVFTRQDSPAGENGLWKIRPDGSDAERLVEGVVYLPEASPDGRDVFITMGAGQQDILRLEDGVVTPAAGVQVARPRWSVERGTSYLWGLDGEGAVRRFRFDPERVKFGAGEEIVPHPPGRQSVYLGVARDGSAAVVSARSSRSQIVRVDGLEELERR
jgi:Tol biopolymer transport system component